MNYKEQLKKRIKKIQPDVEIKKIKLCGDSFKITIEYTDINLRQLEQELREELSMPTLLIVKTGE